MSSLHNIAFDVIHHNTKEETATSSQSRVPVSVFIVGTCTMTPGISSMPMIDQDPYPDPSQGPGPDPTQGPHKHMS